ncbi:MAG TPA: RT0821/Lpp0805 family surface protein [Deferrisomatales bacterium]|nr:RT0821/Lpp0805 family surface protein [Deferrisomatales bacterium]
MTDTLQHALEYNPTNESSDWVNPDTGRAGGVVPVRTFEGAQGQPCREFVTTITIGGREEQGYGTACRQEDGDWQIVADDLQAPPVTAPAAPREARAYPPPAQYYSYPDGFYGPARIFLSFSFVHRSGHRHPGLYFLDGGEFRHRYPFTIHEHIFVGPRVYDHYPWRDSREHRGRDDRRGGDNHRVRNHYEDGGGHRGGDDRGRGDDRRGRDERRGRGRGSDDR